MLQHFEGLDITQCAATICKLLGAEPAAKMEPAYNEILNTAEIMFSGTECNRLFVYNPDAIALWIYEKYRDHFNCIELDPFDFILDINVNTVYPPVTPVCFASMYSGLSPEEHGIQKYVKPVLTVPTVFDILPVWKKQVAVICTKGDSISKIFLDRKIDYFFYRTIKECNSKAHELIKEDYYDFIVLYNGNYDYWMHRVGPTGPLAVRALDQNIESFCSLRDTIRTYWKHHNSVLAFAPDHGCHKKYQFFGAHGENTAEDMITHHYYQFIARK